MNQIEDVDVLKYECILEFEKYIKQLQKGYQPDYKHILNMINFIKVYNDLDNKKLVSQYLLNYVNPYIRIC